MKPWRAVLLAALAALVAPALLVSPRALAQSAAPAAPAPSDAPAARSAPSSDASLAPEPSRGTQRRTQYVDASLLDLVRLLPPPPANDSAETRAELDAMLKIQKKRTDVQVSRAQADDDVTVNRFADALGAPPGFDVRNLPVTTLLFRKITTDEFVVVGTGKDKFARPRPFVLEKRLRPVVKKPPNGSYPSGHTVWGHTVGLVLSEMVPERRMQLMRRAEEYANNRVIAGVHYPSDIASGRMAATAFAAALFASPAFQSDLAAAKAELRQALNLTAAMVH
ncbi:MAG TPA: phosphatase PAP2 family protein [Steroidobacteraceae bacterium]